MKVYLTQRNNDMTEGRGPMMNDLCFLTKDLANEHVDTKPGVMGRRARWSEEEHGDWQVKEIEVFEYSVKESEERKKELITSALEKLTPQEKEALGIP